MADAQETSTVNVLNPSVDALNEVASETSKQQQKPIADGVGEDLPATAIAPNEAAKGMTSDPNAGIGSNPQTQIKVVEEFQYLLEKSQHLFAGLRDLPPIGGHRVWQPYFQKTFEIYTKLWKFQQEHRATLEVKELYGIKRWEIGEIASKIGQLYYHYYLRTSETNYLQEAYVFYEAIRERNYFKEALDQKSPNLAIKKLRYYARFIVVCLLLTKKDTARLLMEELQGFVKDYQVTFKPSDAQEWELVLQEISTFLDAEKSILPVDYEGLAVQISSRMKIDSKFKSGENPIRIQEAVICGNNTSQIKFSELTLDMFRILQNLEREPISAKDIKADGEKPALRVSPHKNLLFRPSFSNLYTFLTNGFKELSEKSALFLYISAEGAANAEGHGAVPAYSGGILTASRAGKDESGKVLNNCLHPMDLVPFSRKPMFVIIESNLSSAYSVFPKTFDQPVVFLLSPTKASSQFLDANQVGEVQSDVWKKALELVESMEAKTRDLFSEMSGSLDPSIVAFLEDEVSSNFLVRFVLSRIIILHHSAFKEDQKSFLPNSLPEFPGSVFESAVILGPLKELIGLLKAGSSFDFVA